MIAGRDGILAALWWSAALGPLVATSAWLRADESGRLFFDREGLILANAWRSPWLDWVFLSALMLPKDIASDRLAKQP